MTREEIDRLLSAAYARIAAREERVGFAQLEHAEQVCLAIWMLEADVKNGGFEQWMYNSSGDHAELAVAGLREIGAEEAAAVCERFFAVLPGGRPLADRGARRNQLEQVAGYDEDEEISDEFEEICAPLERAFYALAKGFPELLAAYVSRNLGGAA